MKICIKCGYTTERESKFCLQCGGPMEDFEVAAENIEAVRIAKMLMEEAQATQNNQQVELQNHQESVEDSVAVFAENAETKVKVQTQPVVTPHVEYRGESVAADNTNKEKKSNTLLYVIIAILIVAVIGMGAFILSGNDSDDNDNEGEEIESVINEEDNADDEKEAEDEELLVDEEEEAEPEFGAPEFNSVYASSELAGDGANTYVASNLADSDYSTAWVEGVEGNGVGEYIVFSSNESQQVSKITIVNGYWKSEEVYLKNSAVKTLEISFSGGEKKQVALEYGYGKVTEIVLDEPVICEAITMKIKGVYPGSECEDTCISEIFFE